MSPLSSLQGSTEQGFLRGRDRMNNTHLPFQVIRESISSQHFTTV